MILPRFGFFCLTLLVVAGPARLFAETNDVPARPGFSFAQVEAARARCIGARRMICGKIVKVLPGGLVVESGYTNLMRRPLENSWLIPGTVEAERQPGVVERREPDSPAMGLVYLTDPPKTKRTKPKVGDYVVLEAFPAGMFHYQSVGTIERTVRHFTGSLPLAVHDDLYSAASGEKKPE